MRMYNTKYLQAEFRIGMQIGRNRVNNFISGHTRWAWLISRTISALFSPHAFHYHFATSPLFSAHGRLNYLAEFAPNSQFQCLLASESRVSFSLELSFSSSPSPPHKGGVDHWAGRSLASQSPSTPVCTLIRASPARRADYRCIDKREVHVGFYVLLSLLLFYKDFETQ